MDLHVTDLVECYLMTSRVALQAKYTDPTTWQDMHTLLPNLHQHLSCRVCHKLLDQPNTYSDGFACTVCANNQITQDTSSSIVQCYKKLCAYIQKSPLYDAMCARNEDQRLVELLTEVIGMSRPKNCHNGLINGAVNKQQIQVVDSLNNIELNSSSNVVQLPVENKISKEYVNVQIFDVQSQKHRIQNQTVINIIPKKKVCVEFFFLLFLL